MKPSEIIEAEHADMMARYWQWMDGALSEIPADVMSLGREWVECVRQETALAQAAQGASTMSDPSTIAAAMAAEDEARRASGIRITYLPGPISRNARGMTIMPSDETKTYDGAWKFCDGVFCNTYPDVKWGRDLVIERITHYLRAMPDLHTRN
jgi:hypothetical protein